MIRRSPPFCSDADCVGFEIIAEYDAAPPPLVLVLAKTDTAHIVAVWAPSTGPIGAALFAGKDQHAAAWEAFMGGMARSRKIKALENA